MSVPVELLEEVPFLFPVELKAPRGFRADRVSTWPSVAGRMEYVEGKLLDTPPCADEQAEVVSGVVFELVSWSRNHPDFVVGTNEAGMLLGKSVRGARCGRLATRREPRGGNASSDAAGARRRSRRRRRRSREPEGQSALVPQARCRDGVARLPEDPKPRSATVIDCPRRKRSRVSSRAFATCSSSCGERQPQRLINRSRSNNLRATTTMTRSSNSTSPPISA